MYYILEIISTLFSFCDIGHFALFMKNSGTSFLRPSILNETEMNTLI